MLKAESMSLDHDNTTSPSSCNAILSSVICYCLSILYSDPVGVDLNMLAVIDVYENSAEASICNWIKLTIYRQF